MDNVRVYTEEPWRHHWIVCSSFSIHANEKPRLSVLWICLKTTLGILSMQYETRWLNRSLARPSISQGNKKNCVSKVGAPPEFPYLSGVLKGGGILSV
jgi:hypothetical protein